MEKAWTMLFRSLCLTVAVYFAVSQQPVQSQARYYITDLSFANTTFTTTESGALGINNAGQVLGYNVGVKPGGIVDQELDWIWTSASGFSNLLIPGSYHPATINDRGTIAGWIKDAYGPFMGGFLLDGTTLHSIMPLQQGDPFLITGIDNNSEVVGYEESIVSSYPFVIWSTAAVSYDPVNGTRTVGSLIPAGDSAANGINNGRIVGWAQVTPANRLNNYDSHAFLYDGTMHDLDTLGGPSSSAACVNSSGQVAGSSDEYDSYFNLSSHAFLYSGGQMYDLDPLGFANGDSSARAINSAGQIVGTVTAIDRHARAFVWTPDPNGTTGKFEILNDLIPPNTGWELLTANGINDQGQIVGVGLYNGQQRAFLLTAIPTFTITGIKIGLPEFILNPTIKGYQFAAYLKGSGQGIIHGRWLFDGHTIKTDAIQASGLSDKTWISGSTVRIPWIVVQGNHTIQFVTDGYNGVQSSVIEASVTGFDPTINGWHFSNKDAVDFLNQAWDGLCMGMSFVASAQYRGRLPLPNNGYLSRNVLYSIIIPNHLAENVAFGAVDAFRLQFSYGRGSQGDSPSLRSESDRMRKHLQAGDPWVLGLLTQRDWPLQHGEGHAIVATGAFYCPNVYLPDKPDQMVSVRHFQNYDPNFPEVFRDMDVIESNSTFHLVFAPYHYKFIGELTVQ